MKTVLVVDDSSSIRTVLKATLTRGGFLAEEASDVTRAIMKIASLDKLDLVVTDLNMPGLSGVELIRRIRAKSPFRHVPILVVSTEHKSALAEEALDAGAWKILTKPFSPEVFLEEVKAILG